MQVRNVTQGDLCAALDMANADFDGNIAFNRRDYAGRTRQGGEKYTVTLTVVSARAPGHRVGFDRARKVKAACWHATKAFMDALPSQAVVVSSFGTWTHGQPYYDPMVGSQMDPCYFSELCDCE